MKTTTISHLNRINCQYNLLICENLKVSCESKINFYNKYKIYVGNFYYI